MRTTVDLDKDILRVAKYLAQERAQSPGRVLADLVRQGLQPAPIAEFGQAKYQLSRVSPKRAP
jgi:hypothetical protein